jgi:hypothetical protein
MRDKTAQIDRGNLSRAHCQTHSGSSSSIQLFLELARIIRLHFNAEMDSHQFL